MCRNFSTFLVSILAVIGVPFTFAGKDQAAYFVGFHMGASMPAGDGGALEDGYVWGLQYGYRLRHFHSALALDIADHDMSSPADGQYDLWDVMLNMYYDFNYQGTWVPFIGGGFGYIDISKDDCQGLESCDDLPSGSRFAYQGLAGIGMQDEGWRFDLQYRYLTYYDNNGFADQAIEGVLNIFLP